MLLFVLIVAARGSAGANNDAPVYKLSKLARTRREHRTLSMGSQPDTHNGNSASICRRYFVRDEESWETSNILDNIVVIMITPLCYLQ